MYFGWLNSYCIVYSTNWIPLIQSMNQSCCKRVIWETFQVRDTEICRFNFSFFSVQWSLLSEWIKGKNKLGSYQTVGDKQNCQAIIFKRTACYLGNFGFSESLQWSFFFFQSVSKCKEFFGWTQDL